MDQWTGGPVDQWTGGPVDRWTSEPVNQWTGGLVDRWTGRPVDRRASKPFIPFKLQHTFPAQQQKLRQAIQFQLTRTFTPQANLNAAAGFRNQWREHRIRLH